MAWRDQTRRETLKAETATQHVNNPIPGAWQRCKSGGELEGSKPGAGAFFSWLARADRNGARRTGQGAACWLARAKRKQSVPKEYPIMRRQGFRMFRKE